MLKNPSKELCISFKLKNIKKINNHYDLIEKTYVFWMAMALKHFIHIFQIPFAEETVTKKQLQFESYTD